jgi:mRNA interferase MazF
MAGQMEMSVSLPEALLHRAEILAQRLNVSQSELVTMALERFIKDAQNQTGSTLTGEKRLVINQGDIYWLLSDDVSGSEAGIRHPHVVIQDDVLNHSRIHTLVVCALTSNIKRANMPGNVLLDIGEANLVKRSVVEVSKVSSVEKAQLGEFIGSVSVGRIQQIWAGMRFLESSFYPR